MTQPLTKEQIAEIKAKAEAATAGPWFDIDFSLPEVIGADKKPSAQDIFVSCCYPDPITVATMHGGFEGWESVEQAKKDAAFIAATNPAAILSLIATLEARDAAFNEMLEALKPFAKEADEYFERALDNEFISSSYIITIGDLRKASSAIAHAEKVK